MSGNSDICIEKCREAIRVERGEIAVEIARLQSREEQLVREDERLRSASEAFVQQPYLVDAKWLMGKLSMSSSAFYRLIGNPARGFPEPVFVDSDRRWCWPAVQEWIGAGNVCSRKVE